MARARPNEIAAPSLLLDMKSDASGPGLAAGAGSWPPRRIAAAEHKPSA
eukprot:CAMPEP_0172802968 /NCGR_PEP_ID=MMETSP1075-20121228/4192_1 /TAXON_ID=2916 /ORGANISM="Ceratium fusus, Strain PA161109" /LENGTH=48 /DNA_ID= /DNA_START= /DNA_END= /DNA_ORIENTATION=